MAIAESIVELSKKFLRRPSFTDPRHAAGDRAEKLAAKFLRKEGYKVLYRDFDPTKYGRGGQIDLVCRDGETLVFVEVKSRKSTEWQRPSEGLRVDQQRRISQGALTWLRLLDNPDISFRFDVVEVVMGEEEIEFDLIQDAFQLSKPYIY